MAKDENKLESIGSPELGAASALHAATTGPRRWLLGAALIVLLLAAVFTVIRLTADEPDAVQPAVTPAAQAAAAPDGGAANPLAMPAPAPVR